jgi:alpha-amylase/alpha-mannosidase (GH57 family)
VSARRHVAIHGHFYQPPRENPWLEAVEVQDSAYPHHDWNARITAECYGPNTAARRVDAQNRILDIVNNFEQISFDVGPTLCHWLAQERPDVYRRILDADRASVRARGGHGNALAQPYNHAIMPLCSRRDKVTQVRWALADFRHRFGREPEGMWLPETAVDTETLEVFVDHGIAFTILAPHQAARIRRLADDDWTDVGAGIDPSRAYRWTSPASGRGLALFFYDGPVSHAVAFEGLLGSGEGFADRLAAAFDDRRSAAQLVHVATDGESYGHHHPFGEMALAAACLRLESARPETLTNYGAFLAEFPPAHAVEIVEASSWSCSHGVERWRADCGCNSGRGWHQRWRAPLREALDWLAEQLDPFFEARAGAWVKDPWEARDDYIQVVLDRSPAGVAAFLERHQLRPLTAGERMEALKLFELERQRLLMYTSCGWFFDDVSGIETVQVLKYAARAAQLARELGGPDVEPELVRRLEAAPSNVPELGSGDAVYRRHVLPAVVDLRRVIAHYAIAAPYQAYGVHARVYAYTVSRLDWQQEAYADTSLAVGRVRVTSDVTTESEEASVAVLHFGGPDFHCGMRTFRGPAAFAAARAELFRHFAGHSLSEVVRALDRHFEGKAYGIRDLFLEERRAILAAVTDGVLHRFEDTYRRLYEENRRLMQFLRESDARPAEALALAARYVLQRGIEREVAGLAERDGVPPRIGELVAEAHSLGLELALEPERVAGPLERALLARMARLAEAVTPDAVESTRAVLRVAQWIGCLPNLWTAQNRFFALWATQGPEGRAILAPLGASLGFALPSPARAHS